MTIPAGQRSSFLEVWDEVASTPDEAGQLVKSYRKICDAWGEVRTPISTTGGGSLKRATSENWFGYIQDADLSHVITIPYVSGVKATGRITETVGDVVYVYEISGKPVSQDGDLLIPVREGEPITVAELYESVEA